MIQKAVIPFVVVAALVIVQWCILSNASKTSCDAVLWSILGGGQAPEASSALLKMQRIYNREPPHDMSIYNTLRVSSNATVAEITKAYRALSLELHPDKRNHYKREKRSSSTMPSTMNETNIELEEDDSADNPDEELDLVRRAYDVLKDDASRLLYHRFGLLDTAMAAMVLTGEGNSLLSASHSLSQEQRRLMTFMGYPPQYHRLNVQERHSQRVTFIAATLVEMLRPLVEGAVSQQDYAHQMAFQVETLKSLPLGAHIIRCVGRAYRRSGQRFLRKHRRRKKTKTLGKPSLHVLDFTDVMRDHFRSAQYIANAALASGKLILKEQTSKYRKETSGKLKNLFQDILPSIRYQMDNDKDMLNPSPFIAELFQDTEDFPHHEEIREQERNKAENAVISTLQVEALWKISKIELDRTIQEACDIILSGNFFFFPSHYGTEIYAQRQTRLPLDNGWVAGSTGQVIETEVGRLRAAAALVLVGDILVQSSKERTS